MILMKYLPSEFKKMKTKKGALVFNLFGFDENILKTFEEQTIVL